MSNYYERYLNGEYEQVWAELLALGGQIRQEPLYSEALAVSRETIRRAKQNIQTLVERLHQLNYKFAVLEDAYAPPKAEYLANITKWEAETGPLPMAFKVFHQEVGTVNFVGRHPKLSEYADELPGEDEEVELSEDELRQAWEAIAEKVRQTTGSTPPLSTLHLRSTLLRKTAFHRKMSERGKPDVHSDPLDILPLEFLETFKDNSNYSELVRGGDKFGIDVATDPIMKAGYSGSGPGQILIPNSAIDGSIFYHLTVSQLAREKWTFVEYLRKAFQWGGFPGLAQSQNPPREELEFLTKELLPI